MCYKKYFKQVDCLGFHLGSKPELILSTTVNDKYVRMLHTCERVSVFVVCTLIYCRGCRRAGQREHKTIFSKPDDTQYKTRQEKRGGKIVN